MGKTKIVKGEMGQGDSRMPDQLSWTRISSVIKKMYTPSNHIQYSALQIKNPCCHGNCTKKSQS